MKLKNLNKKATVTFLATSLFLNQTLLSENIIKENKINSKLNTQTHLLGDYELNGTTLYISNSFIRLIYNCEHFTIGSVCSHHNINFKEDTQILNHKVFEVEIKKEKYMGILLTFKNGQFGFYLFNEKRNKNTFVTCEMFEENFFKNKKVTTNLRKENNLFIVTIEVGDDFTKNYIIDLNEFQSKRLNIN